MDANKKKFSETHKTVTYENINGEFSKTLIDQYLHNTGENEFITSLRFVRDDLGYPVVEVVTLID